MNLIIEFYKGLDTINLIIFWGVIIVILLLLIFAIIIVNKNKKLKQIIVSKEQEIEESKNELAIKDEQINIVEKKLIDTQMQKNTSPKVVVENKKEEKIEVNNNLKENLTIKNSAPNKEIKEEKFIVEEHVKDIQDLTPSMPKIEENTNENNEIKVNAEPQKIEITIPTEPYQRNVLREMSLSQTSPIGIIKKENIQKTEIKKVEEPNNIEPVEEQLKTDNYENNYQREMNSSKEKIVKLYENRDNISKPIKENNRYLEEVSKKLEEAPVPEKIERTEYEIKQEEEAIISYEELMKKKDSLEMIDEEEAIISIEELINKKNEEEKLYNITKEEENNNFINELKHFRSDL